MSGMEETRRSSDRPRIGIDLGGTKISGIVLDQDGQTATHQRVATPKKAYGQILTTIAELVRTLEPETGLQHGEATVGIGTPGAEIPGTGRLQNANSVWLNDQPLRRDLEQVLRRPIRMVNDADCLALSEASDGAAAGYRTVFAAILGTGVGGAIVHDLSLLSGPNGIAGEWGHCPLPAPDDHERPGPQCWCGRHGCLETWLSGPGLSADHTRGTGKSLPAADIAARALRECNPDCIASLDRHLDRLARGLAMVSNIIDPDIIVLGGGLSNMTHLYERLPGAMAPHLFTTAPRCTIVQARHGDDSGVRGAARLWDEKTSIARPDGR
jgi:fructokinase